MISIHFSDQFLLTPKIIPPALSKSSTNTVLIKTPKSFLGATDSLSPLLRDLSALNDNFFNPESSNFHENDKNQDPLKTNVLGNEIEEKLLLTETVSCPVVDVQKKIEDKNSLVVKNNENVIVNEMPRKLSVIPEESIVANSINNSIVIG